MSLLRKWPGLRLRFKLLLIDFAMVGAAQLADDEAVPARKRMEYGRRVMQLARWHERLSALRRPAVRDALGVGE